MGIRRYLYISDTKIDIWLPQVPSASTKKITAQLGFNIGILSGKLEAQGDAKTAPADRVSKCQVLEKYILEKEGVGSPESANEWIAGTVQARVLMFPKYSAVLFISPLLAKTLFLTGSSRHLIGASSMVEITPQSFPSFGSSVVEMLGRMAEKQVTFQTPTDIEWAVESTVTRLGDPAWVRTLRTFEEATEQPVQRVAFLATKLLPPYRQYEVYSPLFVESVDDSLKA